MWLVAWILIGLVIIRVILHQLLAKFSFSISSIGFNSLNNIILNKKDEWTLRVKRVSLSLKHPTIDNPGVLQLLIESPHFELLVIRNLEKTQQKKQENSSSTLVPRILSFFTRSKKSAKKKVKRPRLFILPLKFRAALKVLRYRFVRNCFRRFCVSIIDINIIAKFEETIFNVKFHQPALNLTFLTPTCETEIIYAHATSHLKNIIRKDAESDSPVLNNKLSDSSDSPSLFALNSLIKENPPIESLEQLYEEDDLSFLFNIDLRLSKFKLSFHSCDNEALKFDQSLLYSDEESVLSISHNSRIILGEVYQPKIQLSLHGFSILLNPIIKLISILHHLDKKSIQKKKEEEAEVEVIKEPKNAPTLLSPLFSKATLASLSDKDKQEDDLNKHTPQQKKFITYFEFFSQHLLNASNIISGLGNLEPEFHVKIQNVASTLSLSPDLFSFFDESKDLDTLLPHLFNPLTNDTSKEHSFLLLTNEMWTFGLKVNNYRCPACDDEFLASSRCEDDQGLWIEDQGVFHFNLSCESVNLDMLHISQKAIQSDSHSHLKSAASSISLPTTSSIFTLNSLNFRIQTQIFEKTTKLSSFIQFQGISSSDMKALIAIQLDITEPSLFIEDRVIFTLIEYFNKFDVQSKSTSPVTNLPSIITAKSKCFIQPDEVYIYSTALAYFFCYYVTVNLRNPSITYRTLSLISDPLIEVEIISLHKNAFDAGYEGTALKFGIDSVKTELWKPVTGSGEELLLSTLLFYNMQLDNIHLYVKKFIETPAYFSSHEKLFYTPDDFLKSWNITLDGHVYTNSFFAEFEFSPTSPTITTQRMRASSSSPTHSRSTSPNRFSTALPKHQSVLIKDNLGLTDKMDVEEFDMYTGKEKGRMVNVNFNLALSDFAVDLVHFARSTDIDYIYFFNNIQTAISKVDKLMASKFINPSKERANITGSPKKKILPFDLHLNVSFSCAMFSVKLCGEDALNGITFKWDSVSLKSVAVIEGIAVKEHMLENQELKVESTSDSKEEPIVKPSTRLPKRDKKSMLRLIPKIMGLRKSPSNSSISDGVSVGTTPTEPTLNRNRSMSGSSNKSIPSKVLRVNIEAQGAGASDDSLVYAGDIKILVMGEAVVSSISVETVILDYSHYYDEDLEVHSPHENDLVSEVFFMESIIVEWRKILFDRVTKDLKMSPTAVAPENQFMREKSRNRSSSNASISSMDANRLYQRRASHHFGTDSSAPSPVNKKAFSFAGDYNFSVKSPLPRKHKVNFDGVIVRIPDVKLSVSIPAIYVVLLTVKWLKMVSSIFDVEVKKDESISLLQESPAGNQESVRLHISSLALNLHLPGDVEALAELKNINARLGNWSFEEGIKTVEADVGEVLVLVPKPANKWYNTSPPVGESEFPSGSSLNMASDTSLGSGTSADLEYASETWDTLLCIEKISVSIFKKVVTANSTSALLLSILCKHKQLDIHACISSFKISIPHSFDVSNLIDALIGLNKTITVMKKLHLNIMPHPQPDTGSTVIVDEKIPNVTLEIASFSLKLEDNPFESALSKSYKLGCEEQLARIARDRAFQKKVQSLRSARDKQLFVSESNLVRVLTKDDEIESAWWILQEYYSKAWITKINKLKDPPPPLATFAFRNISLEISPPSLLSKTIEGTLHLIDPEATPKGKRYDLLIPRNITLEIDGFIVSLRDYSMPLFFIPSYYDENDYIPKKALKSKGLLIVAEQFASDASKANFVVPVDPLPYEPLNYFRTINPIKVYLSFNTFINIREGKSFRLTWGANMEPTITDMSRVLDSFTKPNPDPSPMYGWWDKFRIMAHGRLIVHINGGGDLRFRVSSAISPYRKKLGSLASGNSNNNDGEGIEFVLSQGSRIVIGSEEDHYSTTMSNDETFVVETGSLKITAPNVSDSIDPIFSIDPKDNTSKKSSFNETVIAKLVGGVRVGFSVLFLIAEQNALKENINERPPTKTHCDIILCTPSHVSKHKAAAQAKFVRKKARTRRTGLTPLVDEFMDYDAFRGFRTNSMHLDIKIVSPHSFYSSLTHPINSLSLNPSSLRRVSLVTQIYQSPLTNIPIQRGRLFIDGIPSEKPKLSRALGSLRIKVKMLPLVLGLLHDLEEDNFSGVGFRCRAEKMTVDTKFVQHLVNKKEAEERKPKSDEALPPDQIEEHQAEVVRSAMKWSLESSHYGFTELEGRALSFGNAYLILQEKKGTLGEELVLDESFEDEVLFNEEDKLEWILNEDFQHVQDASKMRMVPFIWSPNITYFKNTNDPTSKIALQSESDVLAVQVTLFKNRMTELRAAIQYYLNLQQKIENRIRVFADDSLIQSAEVVVEKLVVLYEKKAYIDKYIKNCQEVQQTAGSVSPSNLGNSFNNKPATLLFNHFYIIHNINFLWKKEVRNTIFKLIDLQTRDLSLRYFMSNSAFRIVKELGILTSRGKIHVPDVVENPEVSDSQSKKQLHSDRLMIFDSDMADKLLDALFADKSNLSVNNEREDTTDEASGPSLAPKLQNRFSYINQRSYQPSNDPSSPDYLPSRYSIDSNYLVLLVNPQINFEAESATGELQTLVVAAENMEVMSINIYDEGIVNVIEDWDEDENIAKIRKVLNLHNAQFFIARKSDLEFGSDSDMDNILMSRKVSSDSKQISWPVWVPIECLIDHTSHTGHLQRVMDQTSGTGHRDSPNPLYVKRHGKDGSKKLLVDEEGGGGDIFQVNFPTFIISINSAQFSVVMNIITNLLVYRDPTSGDRTDKLRKVMLGLDQLESIQVASATVSSLQEKIRHAESSLAQRIHQSLNGSGSFSLADSVKLVEMRKGLVKYRDDLFIIMEGLKQQLSLSRNRNSAEVAWQISVKAGKLVWLMKQDNGEPLCTWVFDKTNYFFMNNEDQSSMNSLEINKLCIENQLKDLVFKDILTPYIPDKKPVDFEKLKMLRVFWRELAPVAGIQIVDHFEINLYPLQLQLSYSTAKQLIYYVFPEKKALAEENAAESAASPPTKSLSLAKTSDSKSVFSKISKNDDAKSKVGSVDSTGKSTNGKKESTPKKGPKKMNELAQMQSRASANKSFIYVKVPSVQLCVSYKGQKEKNVEDLNMFVFKMPTLEYKNKTWSWLNFVDQIKKDAIKAVFANAGSLVKEKFFQGKKVSESDATSESKNALSYTAMQQSDLIGLNTTTTMAGHQETVRSVRGIEGMRNSILSYKSDDNLEADYLNGQVAGSSSSISSTTSKKNQLKNIFKPQVRRASNTSAGSSEALHPPEVSSELAPISSQLSVKTPTSRTSIILEEGEVKSTPNLSPRKSFLSLAALKKKTEK